MTSSCQTTLLITMTMMTWLTNGMMSSDKSPNLLCVCITYAPCSNVPTSLIAYIVFKAVISLLTCLACHYLYIKIHHHHTVQVARAHEFLTQVAVLVHRAVLVLVGGSGGCS